MNTKPRILVSSCLLGQKVRYDGHHKHCPSISELQEEFDISAICPETEAGLGVPRPPINLHEVDGVYMALGANDLKHDVTQKLKNWIEEFLNNNYAHGAIFKSKSPSCGYKTTPVYSKNNSFKDSGLFTKELLLRMPELPIIDEIQINNLDEKKEFLNKVRRQFNVS